MKHCTLPTLLAVKTTILPTVPSSSAGQKRQKLLRLVKCVLSMYNISMYIMPPLRSSHNCRVFQFQIEAGGGPEPRNLLIPA